jgi:hypothetical protein
VAGLKVGVLRVKVCACRGGGVSFYNQGVAECVCGGGAYSWGGGAARLQPAAAVTVCLQGHQLEGCGWAQGGCVCVFVELGGGREWGRCTMYKELVRRVLREQCKARVGLSAFHQPAAPATGMRHVSGTVCKGISWKGVAGLKVGGLRVVCVLICVVWGGGGCLCCMDEVLNGHS